MLAYLTNFSENGPKTKHRKSYYVPEHAVEKSELPTVLRRSCMLEKIELL